MFKKIQEKKGFTLIELMIVVAIIGILSAIAIPNFMKFQCRAKQSEAKTLLAGVFTAEIAYFGEFSKFKGGATGKALIGFTPASLPRYYTSPTITTYNTGGSFSATSGGDPDGDATRDSWGVKAGDKNPHLMGANDCN
jgi:type IV pilus assembly protein PilA